MPRKRRRRVCFVTGSRAEFGLMECTLRALRDHAQIELQLIATGMHTHASRGNTIDQIRRDGWTIDAVVPWPEDAAPAKVARHMGLATAHLAETLDALRSDIVLVVGDRVEAFAAASAAHVSGKILAHVHGGDRAMGQVDDSLRHAISKLAHVHLCATRGSGERLFAMGEDRARIHVVGAPGIDGIRSAAATREQLGVLGLGYARGQFVLFLLHPTAADDAAESRRARLALDAIRSAWQGTIVALLPNSDPGSEGIADELHRQAALGRIELLTHASRGKFLGLLRDCRALVGNSSSGIIEAGSFRTPVINIGPRQLGRERGGNVVNVPFARAAIVRALRGLPLKRRRSDNPYDRGGAAERITAVLASAPLDGRLQQKVIRY